MRSSLSLSLLLVATLCLAGCQGLFDGSRVPTPIKDQPTNTTSTRRVESSANIGHLQAPAEATASEPVSIVLWAYVGTNGCDGMGTPSLDVNDGSRSVTVRATAWHLVGDNLVCSMNYPGYERATVSFTPGATGTYEVRAEPFEAMPEWEREHKIGTGVTPAATLAIAVVAASSSVLPDGNQHDSSQQ
ncbi:MAG TPA: hypothetical protein V6D05_06700 [Stenomitos sp.]